MLTLTQTPAEQQLECSKSDSLSQFDTPTQSQDSDQVNSQPNENTPSILSGCPVCKVTFYRAQERNQHVESYLPHSILCPFRGCVWMGHRQMDFKGHWKKGHQEKGHLLTNASELLTNASELLAIASE